MSLSKTLKEEVMTLNYCETKIKELEEEITLLEKRLQEESLCLSFLEKTYIEDTIGEYRDLIAKLVIKKHEIEEYPCIKVNLVDSFKMKISYKERSIPSLQRKRSREGFISRKPPAGRMIDL